MTNYESIISMSLENMAVMLVEMMIEKENQFNEFLISEGIDFEHISFSKEVRYKNMQNWLESMVREE